MEKADLKRIAVEAAMERVVGSTAIPARYFAKLVKELEKLGQEYKKALVTVTKYEELLDTYIAELERVQQMKEDKPGEDGYTPIKGVDYFDGAPGKDAEMIDMDFLVETVLSQIPKPENGKDAVIDYNEVAELVIEKLKADSKLSMNDIKGFREEMASYRNQLAGKIYGKDTWARGSGTTVSAGSNVTLVPQSDGTVQINASGGGSGTNVTTQYQLTAVQAGSDVTIDLAQLTNFATFSDLIAIYRNNIMQTEGIDFTVAGPIVTINSADASEIFNATYAYA
jgi:hypothetical protein